MRKWEEEQEYKGKLSDISLSRQSEELDLNPSEWELVVTLNKERFKVKTHWSEDGFLVDIDGRKEVVLNTDWLVGEPMMLADMNGKEVTVQVSCNRSFTCKVCQWYVLLTCTSHRWLYSYVMSNAMTLSFYCNRLCTCLSWSTSTYVPAYVLWSEGLPPE